MASTYADLVAAVRDYHEQFRHPSLAPLHVSKHYDLFPVPDQPGDYFGKWPDPWPNGGSAGVYSFLSREDVVLYIGKVSLNNSIAARLGAYCSYKNGRGSGCQLVPGWTVEPRFVVTVAVPDSSKFEAPGLEEYLIGRLQPPDNRAGVARRA